MEYLLLELNKKIKQFPSRPFLKILHRIIFPEIKNWDIIQDKLNLDNKL